ncbi:hypothetical protein Mapa_001200 [Marchantia paleacea]|nr:hypothetical protein Mapa_001200 [Marchantia paleacea]
MVSAGASLWTLLVQLYTWSGPVLMLLYPLYQSILAIESPGKEDDAQWLTYWVIFYSFVELGFDRLLSWIPLWYMVKLIAVAWLVLPPFRGAAYIYDTYVKKYAGSFTVKIERKLNAEQRSILAQMSPVARNNVAHYINENGTDAFDKIVRSAVLDFKKAKSPSGESGRRWLSSDKHLRSPDSSHEKGEKKHRGWFNHFHHSDDYHSERKHGGWSPDSDHKHHNWGWSHHFDGGM